MEGLLVKNHAQQKVSEFGVQFLKRDAFRKSEEAKWEAIREVTPLFCSDIFGRLTSC